MNNVHFGTYAFGAGTFAYTIPIRKGDTFTMGNGYRTMTWVIFFPCQKT